MKDFIFNQMIEKNQLYSGIKCNQIQLEYSRMEHITFLEHTINKTVYYRLYFMIIYACTFLHWFKAFRFRGPP